MTTRPGFSFCICPDGKLLRQQVEELLGAHPDAGREAKRLANDVLAFEQENIERMKAYL